MIAIVNFLRHLAFAALAISLVIAGDPTQSPAQNMTTADVAAKAENIVYARFRGAEMRFTGYGIHTFYEFEVIDQIKGRLSQELLTFAFFGGKIGNIVDVQEDAPPNPKFEPSEEVILFMGGKNYLNSPRLFSGSIYRVLVDARGQRIVTPPLTGMAALRAADGKQYDKIPAALPLKDFMFTLKQEVAK